MPLGGKGYKIVNLNLNTNGYPQPYMRSAMMMKAAAPAMDSAPSTVRIAQLSRHFSHR